MSQPRTLLDQETWSDIGQLANNDCLIYSKEHRFDQKCGTEKRNRADQMLILALAFGPWRVDLHLDFIAPGLRKGWIEVDESERWEIVDHSVCHKLAT